ncbi:MAG: TonB-dependent receptor plug domain-containing protein [Alphaproteobacteria bacterium]
MIGILKPLLTTAAVAALLLPYQAAIGQTTPESKDDYLVTATRVPTPADRIASSNTVVSSQEIRDRGYRDLGEILSAVPGMVVSRSGDRGKLSSVFTRGTNSNHTLFLIDGVRVMDSSASNASFQLEHLDAANIERVEIIRGPQSTLYGSDAIGGVINVITRKGAKGVVVSGEVEFGTRKSYQTTLGLDGTYKNFDLNLHGSYFNGDGISVLPPRIAGTGDPEKDPYRNSTASARAAWRPTNWLEFTGFYQNIQTKSRLDAFGDDPNAFDRTRHNLAIAEAKLVDLIDGRLNTTLRYSYYGVRRTNKNLADALDPFTDQVFYDRSDKQKFELINSFIVTENHTLVAGAEIEWEEAATGGNSFFAFDKSTRNRALYFQDQFQYFDRIFGTVGFRIDDNDRFGTHWTWRVAPLYWHKETDTKIKASVGTGFKAPSIENLFGFNPGLLPFFPPTVGNPNLRPETSLGFDVGFEQRLFAGDVIFGATFFYNKIKNLIQFRFDPALSTVENVGRARTYGVESFIQFDLTRHFDYPLRIKLDHTYTEAENEDTGGALLRRPQHKFGASVWFKPMSAATVTFGFQHIGPRIDADFFTGARKKVPGYNLVRIAGSYEVIKGVSLFARVENLFDRTIEDPDGFQQPGITAFGGIRVQLNVLQ